MNDNLLSILLLYSLPSTFENFRCAIESRDHLPKPQELRVKIIEEHDPRRNDRQDAAQNAMVAGHRKFLTDKSKEKMNKRDDYNDKRIKCFKCKKLGHRASECRSRKGDTDKSGKGKQSSLYVASESNICKSTREKNDANEREWCLDSGCTSHLCNNLENFTNVKSDIKDTLNLANFSTTNINAKGVVRFATRVPGNIRTVDLKDTLFVPDLRTNLLSVGRIVDKGYSVIFKKDSARVVDTDGDIILSADRSGGLFYVKEFHTHEGRYVTQGKSTQRTSSESWHRKLSHLNMKDLREAWKKGIIRGLQMNDTNLDVDCEICIRGKSCRKPFPKRSNRVTEPGELIHTDLCGPMRVPLNGKALYFVTFIDDANRWCEVSKFQKCSSNIKIW